MFKLKLILFFTIFSLFSETVFLRDGSILRGKLKSQNINEIIILTEKGEEKISKDKTFRVLYKDMSETEAKKTFLNEIEKLDQEEKEKLLKELNDEVLKNEAGKSGAKVEVITKWSFFRRSAILPGWGHIFAKQYKTGFFYSAIFFSGVIFTGSAGSRFFSSREDLENNETLSLVIGLCGNPTNAILFSFYNANNYQNLERFAQINQGVYYTSIAGLSAFYIFQLTHAYITGTKLTTKKTGFQFDLKKENFSNQEIGNHYTVGYKFEWN